MRAAFGGTEKRRGRTDGESAPTASYSGRSVLPQLMYSALCAHGAHVFVYGDQSGAG